MADEKNVTLTQFKDFVAMADDRLDKLEIGKAAKVSPVSITIPTEGWAPEEIGETDEEGTKASYFTVILKTDKQYWGDVTP